MRGNVQKSEYVSTGKAAEMLGVSDETVRTYRRLGVFPGAYRPSGSRGHWKIPKREVEAYRRRMGG